MSYCLSKVNQKKKKKSTFTNHHGAAYLRIRHSCPIRTLSFSFSFSFFDEPETILKRKETELQRPPRLFQNDGRETSKAISKIKGWAAVLHCLGTHFTKTLSNTDKDSLNSEHKDQNLQGGDLSKSLRRFTQY